MSKTEIRLLHEKLRSSQETIARLTIERDGWRELAERIAAKARSVSK